MGSGQLEAPACFIIPAYNEAEVIEGVVGGILDSTEDIVIVVDDGSADETFQKLRSINSQRLTVLRHTINTGQGGALRTGIEYALEHTDCTLFVTFDSDGQHRVEDVKRMKKALTNTEAQVALGTRFSGVDSVNMKPAKKTMLKLATRFSNLVSGLELTDTHNGLRVFKRDALEKIEITLFGMAHASEILNQIAQQDIKHIEVPVKILYTDYSLSKGQASINAVNILFDMIFSRRKE